MPLLPASDSNIIKAAKALREGQLVSFPTETVYGLGADATNSIAVAAIFEAKGRPRFNPLIVHVPGFESAQRLAYFSEEARKLAKAFWPGALTLVLPKMDPSGITELTTAGLETIALRAPAHPVAQALLQEACIPVAAPSANRSGHVSATTAQHVHADLGNSSAFILDDGATTLGLESTIIGWSEECALLLRPGAIAREGIEALIGAIGEPARSTMDAAQPASPGQLESHYAPRAALRLDAVAIKNSEALLAFGPDVPDTGNAPYINLSPSASLHEAAANLFSALRSLDESGVQSIAVMPVPEAGLGEAINDRLRRAAAPR